MESCWFCFTAPLKSGCQSRLRSAWTTSLLPSLLTPSCSTRLSKMLPLKHISGISPVPLLYPHPFTWSILQSTGLVWSLASLLPVCLLSFLCKEFFSHPPLSALALTLLHGTPTHRPASPTCPPLPRKTSAQDSPSGLELQNRPWMPKLLPALGLDGCSHRTARLLNINYKHSHARVKYNYTHNLGKNGLGAVCSMRISCTPKLKSPQQPQISTDSVMTGQIILPT